MIHTVLFNSSALCFNQCGVSFFNETTGSHALSFSSSTKLPAKLIVFDVKWLVKPQKGDRIKWSYDGAGAYQDVYHNHMLAQEIYMVNCEDINDLYDAEAA